MDKDAVHAATETAGIVEIIENVALIRDKYPKAADEVEAKIIGYVGGALEEMGLKVTFLYGNAFATLPGTDADLPAVALVSRLNCAPAEGKYGCALGAACTVAVIGSLIKNKTRLSHPVEIIVLTGELPEKPKEGMKAFLELGIEYGGVLAREEVSLGIVGTIALPTKLKITVTAETRARLDKTPLNERQDALVSAAALVMAVRNIAAQEAENGIVATVERVSMPPGGKGLIPARVEMWVDIRGLKHDKIIEVLQEIKDEASAISEEQNVTISIAVQSSERPVRMDGDIARLMDEACRKYKISYEHLDSLAEYTAAQMAGAAGGALMLVPCRRTEDNPAEEIVDKKDIEGGVKVLSEVLCALAK